MKTKRVIIISFLLFVLSSNLFADRSQALDYLQEYLDVVNEYGWKLSDYGDGGEGDSWWCWSLKPREKTYIERMFFKGIDYTLVACGDDDATDVDIEVYDENWNLIVEDDSIDSFALVQFSPYTSGVFHIKTTYYNGNGRAHVGFFIAYQND